MYLLNLLLLELFWFDIVKLVRLYKFQHHIYLLTL